MKTRLSRLACVVVCLALAGPALSQVGHPAKGSWSGYWGPDANDKHRMLLILDWRNNELTGVINPGKNAAEIERASLDPATWTLTIEADMPFEDGSRGPFIATGKLENLGSWTNRRYSGTYRHGDETGEFMVTLN
jgi:hypothetical protein